MFLVHHRVNKNSVVSMQTAHIFQPLFVHTVFGLTPPVTATLHNLYILAAFLNKLFKFFGILSFLLCTTSPPRHCTLQRRDSLFLLTKMPQFNEPLFKKCVWLMAKMDRRLSDEKHYHAVLIE